MDVLEDTLNLNRTNTELRDILTFIFDYCQLEEVVMLKELSGFLNSQIGFKTKKRSDQLRLALGKPYFGILPVKLEHIGKPNIFPTPLPISDLIRIFKCKVLANSRVKCKSHKSLYYDDMGGEYYNIIYEVNLLNTKELNKCSCIHCCLLYVRFRINTGDLNTDYKDSEIKIIKEIYFSIISLVPIDTDGSIAKFYRGNHNIIYFEIYKIIYNVFYKRGVILKKDYIIKFAQEHKLELTFGNFQNTSVEEDIGILEVIRLERLERLEVIRLEGLKEINLQKIEEEKQFKLKVEKAIENLELEYLIKSEPNLIDRKKLKEKYKKELSEETIKKFNIWDQCRITVGFGSYKEYISRQLPLHQKILNEAYIKETSDEEAYLRELDEKKYFTHIRIYRVLEALSDKGSRSDSYKFDIIAFIRYLNAIGRIEEYILEYAKCDHANEMPLYGNNAFSAKFKEEYNKIITIKKVSKLVENIKKYKTIKEGMSNYIYKYELPVIKSEVKKILGKQILAEVKLIGSKLSDYV